MKSMSLDDLVTDLRSVHADNLVSVILYGSSVTGNHVDGVSDRNVLVVLGTLAPKDLRAAHSVAEKWHKSGHPIPLYFTHEEIRDAADVFPVEFLDMSEHHRTLFGSDVFQGLAIASSNLRHQVEYELRGKLIRLRELYIPAGRAGQRLSRLMTDSLPNFVTLFRHVLGMRGHQASHAKREVIDKLGTQLGLDVTVLHRLLELRETEQDWSLEEAERAFSDYLATIESVIEVVDSLDVRTH